MVFARFRFKKMLVFQAKHNFFICPNERVRRQIHRKQFFMAFSESFLGRKLQERGKNHYTIQWKIATRHFYNLQSTISLDGWLFETIYWSREVSLNVSQTALNSYQ